MRLGIMQGRLSPPAAHPQSFPFDSWQSEFWRARTCGFDLIEWLLDGAACTRNPLWTAAGMTEIRRCITATGVSVESICADYFVDYPLLRVPERERRQHLHVLNRLVEPAARLGARVIVLPVLGRGEPRDASDDAMLLESLVEPLATAHDAGVTLALELNIPRDRCLGIIRQAAHPALSMCLDTGNRAAQGLDIVEDMSALAPCVREVHIKDRLLDGPNVPLGEGVAPLDAFLDALTSGLYRGPLILETTAGDGYLHHATRNLRFVKSRVSGGRSLNAHV
jgi:hexulose-6-phosphate isomerase